ncbi:aminotransferase class IV [uncultured Luteimonas sp.]|uniref:aminotransferase class IV n=1 Tax=uncultured Luteimonas sp. TaxID=453144 RepID=UPI00260C0BD2|nr:aminotransferase class IV [uncultured Luteimonas sp.]
MSLAFLDGRPASADDLRALALANYGHFTSMQVRGRAVQGLELHLHRLKAATRELFDARLDDARIREAILAALDAAVADDASVRVTAYARDFDYARPDRTLPVDLLVSLNPPRQAQAGPAWVKTYAFQRPLPHLKHVGTFPLFQHRRQALREGVDDALFVDARGRISEGSVWNIGFWDGRQVVWPQAEALRGTAERLLQAGLAETGVAQRHAPVEARALAGMRAAFAANATGIWPIAGIDETTLRPDPALIEALAAALRTQPWRPLAG